MKKVVAILLAGVLTLGASMTAFAAPSPSASATDTAITATASTGEKVVVSQNYATEAEQTAAADIKADPTAKLTEVVGAEEAKDMSFVSVQDVTVEGYKGGPITITFNVPGVTASSKVIVLHYVNGAWQKEAPTAGKGTITVTFSSLSPVAIYVDKDTAANAGTTDSSKGGSPKTGEAPVMAMVVVVVALAAAGMTVSARRRQA